jgi:hypothetical protein
VKDWLLRWWFIPLTACGVLVAGMAYAFGDSFGRESVALRVAVATFGAACLFYAARTRADSSASEGRQKRSKLQLPSPHFEILMLAGLAVAFIALGVTLAVR